MPCSQWERRYPERDDLKPGAAVVSLFLRAQPELALDDALLALLGCALSRRRQGRFIVHLDNSDPDPLNDEALDEIYSALAWLRIPPDEYGELGQYGPYSQRERRDLYRDVAQRLIDEERAYHCFCQHEGDCRCHQLQLHEAGELLESNSKSLIRFRVPKQAEHSLHYEDPLLGDFCFDRSQIEDFVLLTPAGMPQPYFAHVVDNHFMHVTIHLRRRSALSYVPHELMLHEALGWQCPRWLHLPPLHDPTWKRLFEEPPLGSLQQRGYTDKALVNYLTQLIWTHPDGKHIYGYRDFWRYYEIEPLSDKTLAINYQLLDSTQAHYSKQKV